MLRLQVGELKPKLEKIDRSPSLTSALQTADGEYKPNDSDLLQNLLSVENAAINQMLNSADSAAQLLGVDWYALYRTIQRTLGCFSGVTECEMSVSEWAIYYQLITTREHQYVGSDSSVNLPRKTSEF